MNNKHLFLKIILILICLLGLKSVYAQKAFPYLFIQYEDNMIFELKLSNDFLIENQSGILEIRGSLLENPITMPLKTISLFGIMYKETVTDDAGMDSFIDNTVNDIWQVYDIKGRLLRETNSNVPDLKNLPSGEIFIIKNGSSSFKYIPYK